MLLLIDAKQATHRAYHIAGLSYMNQHTNVLYGVLNSTLSLVDFFSPDVLVFCWDSKKSLRKEVYPEYKANRRKSGKDYTSLWQQESQLKDIIPQLGWNQFGAIEGLEADDLIANICHQSDDQIIIVSNDSDMYQLLDKKISMYFPIKKELFTANDFIFKYRIDPNMWVLKDAIAGTHNNIKGVKGIGEKKTLDYLRRGIESKYAKMIDDQFSLWEPNIKLIELPYRKVKMPEWKDLTINIDMFIDICQLYSFKSFIKQINKWKEVFNGK